MFKDYFKIYFPLYYILNQYELFTFKRQPVFLSKWFKKNFFQFLMFRIIVLDIFIFLVQYASSHSRAYCSVKTAHRTSFFITVPIEHNIYYNNVLVLRQYIFLNKAFPRGIKFFDKTVYTLRMYRNWNFFRNIRSRNTFMTNKWRKWKHKNYWIKKT